MNIILDRRIKGDKATEGEISILGKHECFSLEPVDRGLTSDMPLENIKEIKKANPEGKTALPTGTFPITKFFSPAHNMFVPRLMNTPGFDFAEIHTGNTDADTLACIVVGLKIVNADFISDSGKARDALYQKIFEAIDRGEPVTITIQ